MGAAHGANGGGGVRAIERGRIPGALAGTQAGRLLADILGDPSLPHSAARAVPPRGAQPSPPGAEAMVGGVPAVAPDAPVEAPTVAPGWPSAEVEEAQVAAGRRERRVGIGLVLGAVLVVGVANALVLALRGGPVAADRDFATHAPAALQAPAGEAPAVADPSEDAPLIIDEPLNVRDDATPALAPAPPPPLIVDRIGGGATGG